jgi:AraC-like DNA-binding protein
MTARVNPADPDVLGRANAVLTGRARRHHVAGCRGVLSLKGVLQGEAAWTPAGQAFRVIPGRLLVLNHAQDYSLTIDAPHASHTFCVFFRAGAVEEAMAAFSRPHAALIEQLGPRPQQAVDENLVAHDTPVAEAWRRLAAEAPNLSGEVLDDRIEGLARLLAAAALADRARSDGLVAARPATRTEILRRLRRAVAAMEDEPERPWTLATMARAAALSPHHFHRCFVACFGETPRAYLTRRRLDRARALLLSGACSVTEACLAVGFESLPSFSRAFRAGFGVAPSRIGRADA